MPENKSWDTLTDAFGAENYIEMVECTTKTVGIYVEGCDKIYEKFEFFSKEIDERLDI